MRKPVGALAFGDEQGSTGSHEGFSGCLRWPLLLAQGRFHLWKEALAFETCNEDILNQKSKLCGGAEAG